MDETNVLSQELKQSIESGVNLPQPTELRSSIDDIPDSWDSIAFNGTTNPYDMSEEERVLNKLSQFSVYNVTKHILSGAVQGITDLVTTPRKAMQEGTTTEQAIPWATNAALATVGTGTNFSFKLPSSYATTAETLKRFDNPYAELDAIGVTKNEWSDFVKQFGEPTPASTEFADLQSLLKEALALEVKPTPAPKKELRLTNEVNVFKQHIHPDDPNFYWDPDSLQYLPLQEEMLKALSKTKPSPSKGISISREGDFFYANHPDHHPGYIGSVYEVSPGVFQADVGDIGIGKYKSKEKAYDAIKHEIQTTLGMHKNVIKTPEELKNYYTNVEFADEPNSFVPKDVQAKYAAETAKMQAELDAAQAKWEKALNDQVTFEQVPYTPQEYKPAPTPDPNFSEWDSYLFDMNRKYIDALPEPRGLKTDLPLQQTDRVQRAKELGFNLDPSQTEIGGDWYHGTKKIFEEFNIGKSKSEDAVFLSNNPDIAKIYGNHIIPVWTRAKNVLIVDLKEAGYSASQFEKIINKARAAGKDAVLFKNVYDMGGKQDQLAILKENMIRSKFAIFDKGAKELTNLTATGVGGAVILRRFLNETENQR